MSASKAPYTVSSLLRDTAQAKNFFGITNTCYCLLAFVIYLLHYCTMGVLNSKTLDPLFVITVFVRNFGITLIVYSSWHYLLYQRKPPISSLKLNPNAAYNHRRDRAFSLAGSLVASFFELAMVQIWITSSSSMVYTSLMSHPLRSVLLYMFTGWWSDIHFYFIHRLIHPWGGLWKRYGLDCGKVLYKNVHYLHHKSSSPGPWSGLAMHPIEHLLYFSRGLWVLLFYTHPVHFLFTNIRAMIGPAPGHHGYADCLGSKFHYLHHAYFECNYGTRGYMDKLFGTYRAA